MTTAHSAKPDASSPQACSLLVRGGVVVTDSRDPGAIIKDGAVCVRGDRIVGVGDYQQLRQEFAPDRICGSDRHVVMPGLVNAHDHIRAPSTLQLGIPDDALEPWIFDLLRLPSIDPRLSSAFACCELIESGVTTVLHSFYESTVEQYNNTLADTVWGCEQTGIRAVFALSTMDDGFIGKLLEDLAPRLPDELRAWANEFLSRRRPLPTADYLDTVRDWHGKLRGGRNTIMVGSVSVHWCSDELLEAIWSEAAALDVPIQTHLLESPFQRHQAMTKFGKSAIEHMADIGLLSPRLSCAHCVQINDTDIGLLADSGTSVVHNASSNLRLRNGLAPLTALLRNGVNIGLGLDSLALNDDADMLQEMRLISTLHQHPHEDAEPLSAQHILQMASVNGAAVLGLQDQIGVLEPGKKADLITLRYNDAEIPGENAIEAIINGSSGSKVDTVIIDGELIFLEGQHIKINKQALNKEIAALLITVGKTQSTNNALIAGMKPYIHQLMDEQCPQ